MCRTSARPAGWQPIGAFPDGTISTYRIVDPQKFILSVSFDL